MIKTGIMNKQLLKVVVTVFLLMTLSGIGLAGEVEDRIAGARKNNLPVLIEFGAAWCIPCQQMQPAMNKIEETYRNKLVVVKVDISDQRDIAHTYGIRVIPTLVFLDKSGKEFKRLLGESTFEEIAAVLKTKGV